MAELLRTLGAEVLVNGPRVTIDVPETIGNVAEYGLVRRLRASINVLGPLVARCGQAVVSLPGGDNIGSRGLDFHVMGLERLGATVGVEHGNVVARAPHGLHGAEIELDFPSVGATENLLMAAVLARGTTVIDNAAREPEIADICDFLAGMGAKIDGAGSSRLVVEGVDDLAPTEHTTVPDRLVVGTWAIGAAMTRGDVLIDNAKASHLELVLEKLAATGAEVTAGAEGLRVRSDRRPKAVDIITMPYPGFPTDLQAIMVSLLAISEGTGMVSENIYEARFMYVNELSRLGARIRTDGHHASVRGQQRLSGAPVMASDIRAGAGLVLGRPGGRRRDDRRRCAAHRPRLPGHGRHPALPRGERRPGERSRRLLSVEPAFRVLPGDRSPRPPRGSGGRARSSTRSTASAACPGCWQAVSTRACGVGPGC